VRERRRVAGCQEVGGEVWQEEARGGFGECSCEGWWKVMRRARCFESRAGQEKNAGSGVAVH